MSKSLWVIYVALIGLIVKMFLDWYKKIWQ
jgi:hypothetical protein